jgi:hypothetical protein
MGTTGSERSHTEGEKVGRKNMGKELRRSYGRADIWKSLVVR